MTHDGDDTPEVLDDEGEPRDVTDFKFTPWPAVANAFEPALLVDPKGFDPRR